jgi:hypothetical protein
MLVTFNTTADVTATDGDGGRTIRGVAVPWNQVGTVADGTRVRFLPGALDAAARPIVTLGHDGPPIGRTADNLDDGAGMATQVRVSRVRDGDDALTLAADGVLGMFSVGVNPTDWSFDDDGVMVVAAGDWHHTALLPFGAFPQAVVTDVAASQPNGGTMTTTAPDVTATPATAELEPVDPAPVVVATAPQGPRPVPISTGRPTSPPLTLQRYATLVAAANRGEITTEALRATITAALQNITTTDAAEVVQPAYRAEITGLIDHGTPLLQALSQSPLPGSGMSIEFPRWTVMPATGVQATEKSPIVSQPVGMEMASAPVKTIAGGNDLSLQAVERSSPSFLEAYLRAMAVDWGRKAEAEAITALLAVAQAATPGADFLANVAALYAELDPAVTPSGPLFLAMSRDVALPLITVTAMDGPAYWSGAIRFGDVIPQTDADGLNAFVDWNLPPGTMLMGASNGATWHQSAGAPADIRVIDVSLLGLDVGVYGYVCLTIEYPGAFAKMDTTP